ncbi:PAS domain S-box protein [Massilia glaciei]|uniref:histidine kinase n=2 Tax=Massilia glaciei TaxID=1524097 RepID=A0A2U2HHL4_9BURK|nr:PAS domain S-box protein [Massilia glaciei]
MKIKKYLYDRGVGASLALAFSLLSVLLTVVFGELVGVAATEQVKASIGNGLAELAVHTADKLDRGMFERHREMRLMSEREALVSPARSPASRRRALESLQRTYPYYAWIGTAATDGTVQTATGGMLEGVDVSARPWFGNALRGVHLGDVREASLLARLLPADRAEPRRFVDVAIPYGGSPGAPAGVLGAQLSWDWAADIARSVNHDGAARKRVEAIIVSRGGEVLLGPPEWQGRTLGLASLAAARAGPGFLLERWPGDGSYLVGYARGAGHQSFAGLGWTVLVRQNAEDAYRPVRLIKRQVLWAGIGMALLFSLLGLLAARRITSPLSALTRAARRIQDQDEIRLLPERAGYYEVDVLTDAFNSLIVDLRHKGEALNELNQSLERRVAERTGELERAVQLIRTNENRIETIIQSAPDAYIAVDLEGRVLEWNRLAEQMFGWRRRDALACALDELIVPERHRAIFRDGIANFGTFDAAGFLNRRMECQVVNRAGDEFPIEVTIALAVTDDSHFFSAFLHDISERKEIERMKSEFVSTVSHELRTPLTSIYASLSMLIDGIGGELNKDTATLLGVAHSSCERLTRLVSDVLDVEKINSGHMELHLLEQSVPTLLETAAEAMQGFAGQRAVRLAVTCEPGLRATLDRDRMIQVITNLLSNAVKFSPAGATVRLDALATADGVRVSVGDDGSGIPDSFLDSVFEKFAQADSSDSRRLGGTGLGLSICKSLVEQHGGTITFVTAVGEGTTFTIDLPARPPAGNWQV